MSSVDNYQTELLAKHHRKLAKDDELSLVSLLLKGFKTTGIAIAVWCWGYLGMSVAWIFVILFFHIVSNEVSKQIKSKRKYALQAMCSEKGAILSRVDRQHAWIYFPEIEKAEWLNKMIKHLWPVIAEYCENLLMTTIQNSIQGYMPSNLGEFKFTTVDIGDIPVRIDGVKVYTDSAKREEIVIDINIRYSGDANIKCVVKGINFGIKSLKVNGNMRVIMNPLICEIPIVGGLSVFFLNTPDIDFDMTAAANILDLPVIKRTILDIVRRVVSDIIVLPRRMPFALNANVELNKIRYPPPQGLVVLHVIEAKDLKTGDVNLIGKGKSDPYCTITVGNQVMKTSVIPNSLNPMWNQFFQAVVDQKHGQAVDVKVFDEDSGSAVDDSLGSSSLDIDLIASKKTVDVWLPLGNVQTGSVHLRALWMSTSTSMEDYSPREATGGASDTFATALLLVVLESASNLPLSLNTGRPRNPFIKLKIGSKEKQSSIKNATSDPVWSENFNYFLTDPQKQQLELQLMHKGSSREQTLATVMVPINSVMLSKDLSLTKVFNFPEVNNKCTVTVRFVLRILVSAIPPSTWVDSGSAATSSFGSLFKKSFTMSDSSTPSIKGNVNSSSSAAADTYPSFGMGLGGGAPIKEEPKVTGEKEKQKKEAAEGGDALHKKEKNDEGIKPQQPPHLASQQPSQQPLVAVEKDVSHEVKSSNKAPTTAAVTTTTTTTDESTLPKHQTPSPLLPPPASSSAPQPSPSNTRKETTQAAAPAPPITLPVLDPTVSSKTSKSKFGQIQLTIRYSSNRSTLVVVVHQCKALIPCDKDNLADPYVRIYLLPDRSNDSKRKTKIIENTLNPCFDETFEWKVGSNMELAFRSLDVAVKNDVGMFSKSRTEMGGVVVDLSQVGDLSQAITQWYDLCEQKQT